jgi:tetratricopeptide (TPR) repeat protein
MAETVFKVSDLIENRYKVLSVINSGGMGTLYRVSDEIREGRILGLKTVPLNIQETAGAEYFQREFQLLTQMRHPNLVSVYDFGITIQGEFYFTMEWVKGQALDPDSRSLEPAATVPIIVQICRALSYLHTRGVVHGDLKPANVLLVDDRVKIVDFGVALEIKSFALRAHYHTPGYSAPDFKLDHRMDLYSLGATWYALLLGEPPMFMSGGEYLIQLMLTGVLETQTQVPVEIGEIIVKLLAHDPGDRYSGANEVIEAINQVTGSHYDLETRETSRSYALRSRFVGREAELETLQAIWEQAQATGGRIVLVGGESGVGKTRLVEEFVVPAELKGARVARGQCLENDGTAYRAWREILRVLIRYVELVQYAEIADQEILKRVGPVLALLLPELREREYLQGMEPPAELDPQAAQQRLNDAIVQVLRAAAELRPTVVVIEDAHWADEATLELLRSLARVSEQAGLLVCVTYRSDEIEPKHVLAALAAERIERIMLPSLMPEVTSKLVLSMLGLEQIPVSLTQRVQQVTGGNAFFTQELIRTLAEDGVALQRTVAGWRVDSAALQAMSLPASIRQVVGQRLARLSAEAQQVLRWASVAGPLFWEGIIVEIGRLSGERVRATLREALDRELIFERETSNFEGEREFLFVKPSVHEASYESVPLLERQEHHRRAAAWLLAQGEEPVNEHLGLIAGHLEQGGQTEQAVTYWHRAGEQAAAQFANSEAIGYLSRALNLAPEAEYAERYELLLIRERIYYVQGMREVWQQDLSALKESADALDDDRRRAEVALRQAHYFVATGDFQAAIAATQSTIDLARAAQDRNHEAAGCLWLGRTLWHQGKYDAAWLQIQQALILARAAGTRQVEADSLHNLGNVSGYRLDFTEAAVYWEQGLAIYREIGYRVGEVNALSNIGEASMYLGDYTGAKTYFESSLSVCREIGERRHEGHVLCSLGLLSLNLGDYAGAGPYLDRSLHMAREVVFRRGEATALVYLGLLSHCLGDNEAAQEHSRQALLVARDIGERDLQGRALTNLGHALAGLGHRAEAAELYQQALTLRRELGQRALAMESLTGLADVSLTQRDLARAQTQVEEILSYLETNTLAGTEEPFRIYLTCYRILQANQDSRARTILDTAYHLLQERAAKISDEDVRRMFLENVAAHREIIGEFAKSQETTEDRRRTTDDKSGA